MPHNAAHARNSSGFRHPIGADS
eukprot:SAG25_NODE_1899_length_2176_cov_2.589312_5_plen_22_part_01